MSQIQEKFFALVAEIIDSALVVNERQQTKKRYTTYQYVKELFLFVRNSVYWTRYKGSIINGKTLQQYHIKLIKAGIYELIYTHILDLYFKKQKNIKLEYQSVDVKFVPNKNGIELSGRNKYYKNKNGIKISIITDVYGIMFAMCAAFGNDADSAIFNDTFDNKIINTNTEGYKNTTYQQYFLADKAYDAASIRHILEENGYVPLIPKNKRNSKANDNKDEDKWTAGLNKKEKKKYKFRITVENSFSWISQYPVLNFQYEKTIQSYVGLYLFAWSYITFNRNECDLQDTQNKVRGLQDKKDDPEEIQQKKQQVKQRKQQLKAESDARQLIKDASKLIQKINTTTEKLKTKIGEDVKSLTTKANQQIKNLIKKNTTRINKLQTSKNKNKQNTINTIQENQKQKIIQIKQDRDERIQKCVVVVKKDQQINNLNVEYKRLEAKIKKVLHLKH